MAVQCNFGNQLEHILRDKFVTGLVPGLILDRLCEIDEKKSLQDMVDTALQKEAIIKEASALRAEVNQVKSSKPKFISQSYSKKPEEQNKSTKNEVLKCFSCGKSNHNFQKCKFKTFKCIIFVKK